MGKDMKVILDSVHGNIYIPKDYVRDFIDTECFQRLRRIEQTSCRAVFPSARHDRFIHSLGVFHLGSKFVCSIKNNPKSNLPDNHESVFKSYLIACLLHDVGHSPFSHTFEGFYEKENSLTEILVKILHDEIFEVDISKASDMKPHEKMSAILAANVFGKNIDKNGGDVGLVVRMIIGCPFTTDAEHSFENAMIQLIHGDIIDADRLDYALRDVWAAGYNTSTINVQRLIDNTLIEIGEDGLYHVCYSSKALNEIESVLNVKSFQNLYIFSHHKSVYEQKLLIEAMKSASEFHWYGNISEDNELRNAALGKTCDVNSMYKEVECVNSHYKIHHPMDDDFITMMKYIPDDYYVAQWFSRQYNLRPLWKTKAEFYFLFGDILSGIEITQKNAILEWLGKGITKELKDNFKLTNEDLLVVPQNVKYSELDPNKIMIKIGEQTPLPLCKLSHDGIGANGSKEPFSYIYARIEKNSKEEFIDFIKNKINELIKSDILNFHIDEEI